MNLTEIMDVPPIITSMCGVMQECPQRELMPLMVIVSGVLSSLLTWFLLRKYYEGEIK